MKTWYVDCSCRLTTGYIIKAETEEEAECIADEMFCEEDLNNLEWYGGTKYDTWEITED